MTKIIDYFKQYIGVISIVLAVSILLTYTLSYFMVNTGNKRAAEMYVGELQYSIMIDGTDTNVVTIPKGESIIDLTITGIDEINTHYKLLYTYSGSGVTVTYFDKTQDTSGNSTIYDLPDDSLTAKNTKKLKLKIDNTSTTVKTVTFKVSGGYSTNTLADVEVPSGYKQISLTSQYSNTYFCTTSDTLTDGLEYTNDGLTYRYNYMGDISGWKVNSSINGWGVKLTDASSTSDFAGKLCTYINNKPIKSMAYAFYDSKTTSIDLLYFDTHNVINMYAMFSYTSATSLYNLTTLRTNNVTDMIQMFSGSNAMSLDLENFDTSKVTSMDHMFKNSKATTLNLSNFDTSKVTGMYSMFQGSAVTGLDLTSFNTSNVTNMNYMFASCNATTINLSNFNTSNVTSMNSMFQNSAATSLDLNSFDTSKVTSTRQMFFNSKATVIKGLEKFDTSKVTDMSEMFRGSASTTLDLSSFELYNSVTLTDMFLNAKATVGYAKTQVIADKFNDSSVTNIPSTLKFTVKS